MPRKSNTGLVVKKMPDRRHMTVKGMLDEYWQREVPSIPSLPWGAADAGALGQFLKANPDLAVETICKCLVNRLHSDDHAPGERVHIWIGSLLRYAQGPLDRFKLPKLQANPAASIGMYKPSADPTPEAQRATIREQMGEPWFKRVMQRKEAGKLCDLDKDCLREEGLL
jgi:hypothetical protein